MLRIGLCPTFYVTDAEDAAWRFPFRALRTNPKVEFVRLRQHGTISAHEASSIDVLVLREEAFPPSSVPDNGRLALIARPGVGCEKIDLVACTQAGIAVSISPNAVRRPMAVGVVTLVLSLALAVPQKDRLARTGPQGYREKQTCVGIGVSGRTMGLLGFGNIAREVVGLLAPFGMTFIAHDPFAPEEEFKRLGVEPCSLETLLRRSDFLSIHCPLTQATRGLVGRAELAMMKHTAILINTARGAIVDQRALAEALKSGRLGAAGLDVFDPEPPAADEELFRLDNIIATPHSLSLTEDFLQLQEESCLAAIRSLRLAEAPEHLANPDVVRSPLWKAKLERLSASSSSTMWLAARAAVLPGGTF